VRYTEVYLLVIPVFFWRPSVDWMQVERNANNSIQPIGWMKVEIDKPMSHYISTLDRGTAPRSEGSFGKVCGATAMTC